MNFAEKTSKPQHEGVLFKDKASSDARAMNNAVALVDVNRQALIPVGTDHIAAKLKSLNAAGYDVTQYMVGPDERGNYYLDWNRPTTKPTDAPEQVQEGFWAAAAKHATKKIKQGAKQAQSDAQKDAKAKARENERERERMRRERDADLKQQRAKLESVNESVNDEAEAVLARYGSWFQ